MLVHEGITRTPEADRKLGLSLSAVAGALNTAGFYAVGLYASVFTVGQMQQALVLQFGRVRTVLNQAGTDKPGLYFKAEDLAVPEQYRGIGVRIEDDVLITADGNENLSAALPRHPDDVESWMQGLFESSEASSTAH